MSKQIDIFEYHVLWYDEEMDNYWVSDLDGYEIDSFTCKNDAKKWILEKESFKNKKCDKCCIGVMEYRNSFNMIFTDQINDIIGVWNNDFKGILFKHCKECGTKFNIKPILEKYC